METFLPISKLQSKLHHWTYVKMFIPQLYCSNCNEDITSDEELVICKMFNTMSRISNCKTDTTVKFTGQTGNDKVLSWIDGLIVSKHFKLNVKLELAKTILCAKLKILYETSK